MAHYTLNGFVVRSVNSCYDSRFSASIVDIIKTCELSQSRIVQLTFIRAAYHFTTEF